jgi:eukaryotic-like serine/threonine-protein kinase
VRQKSEIRQMTPARWRQIEDRYHAAIHGESAERAALVAQADPEVREIVEQLLDQPSAGGPLDRPASDGMAGSFVSQPAIGSRLAKLGPYRIEELLGSGGMGSVYRALDTRLGRSVAIKIPSEPFDSRFEREGRYIAALNHPNICTLHDLRPDRRPSFLPLGSVRMPRTQAPWPADPQSRHSDGKLAALATRQSTQFLSR